MIQSTTTTAASAGRRRNTARTSTNPIPIGSGPRIQIVDDVPDHNQDRGLEPRPAFGVAVERLRQGATVFGDEYVVDDRDDQQPGRGQQSGAGLLRIHRIGVCDEAAVRKVRSASKVG